MPIGPDESPETPEALMISAMLDRGEFLPTKYHLTTDHLECWEKLWRFAETYQAQAGHAPGLDLVSLQFPDFVFTPNVDPTWASHQLHRAHGSRTLRRTMKKALRHLEQDEVEQAYEQLAGVERPRVARRAPVSVWDHAGVEQDFAVTKIPTPYPTLQRVTGGIGPEDLWFIASRPSEGKTFTLCLQTATAMEQGLNVGYLSLEMPARVINKRIRRILATPAERKLLDSLSPADAKKGLDQLRDRITGTVHVVDPSHGKFTSPVVREALEEYDLVLLDHAGLMHTADGRRAIDDWRAMATISNDLRADVLGAGTPLVAGVQINRTAETSGRSAPKLTQLSQSDALGQDADVVLTFRALSERVRVWSSEKNREGAKAKWWTLFDAKNATFKELSQDAAYEQVAEDEDGR